MSVRRAQLLHRAKDVRDQVKLEINWLADRATRPKSIHENLPIVKMNAFRSFIHYNPHNKNIAEFDITPSELGRVTSRAELSDFHLQWTASKLNLMQSHSVCIYANFIGNIQSFCERRIAGCPERLVFMLNVGRNRFSGETYLGTQANGGSHFSVAVFHRTTSTLHYGDSLGWPAPKNICELVNKFLECIYVVSNFAVIPPDLPKCPPPTKW